MSKIQFHKTEKGLGDEDWYFYVEEQEGEDGYILHEWSHGGPFNFKSGEKTYSVEEFEHEMPNQYKRFIAWREKA